MRISEAYWIVKQKDADRAARLEAHAVRLRNLVGCGESAKLDVIAEALADVCAEMSELRARRGSQT